MLLTPPPHSGVLAKMNLFHKPLSATEQFFLREVSKLFKCYVLVKNFDRKPAISLKTLKIGFFNTLL